MIGHLDGWDIAAQVRFTRQVHKGTILILEGETDARVLGRFVDPSACDIEIAFGKTNVLGALALLEEEGFPGVVAVIDADFDRILGRAYDHENLCLTDFHDLDLTIFASLAFDRYLREHGDETHIKAQAAGDAKEIRRLIVSATIPVACCRLISAKLNLRLYFQRLEYEQFIGEDLAVDTIALTSGLIACSNTRCTTPVLARHLANETAVGHDVYQLTNGHDVAAAFGIALRKLLAKRKVVQTWASEIEAGLRLAFDWEAMMATGLYRCLRAWELRNNPYKIFRQWPA